MAEKVIPMDVRDLIVSWPEVSARGAVSRFCREHGVSRSQFYAIRQRAREEGPLAAMSPQPRSQPLRHSQAIAVEVEELAVTLRKQLAEDGWANGPLSVRQELLLLGVKPPAASTLARIFTRRGMVEPQPQKRPKSAHRRFEAATVHECWQIDGSQWHLADGSVFTILQVTDDKSRYPIASRACEGERSEDAIAVVTAGIERFQVPCRLLSDNGSAFNQERVGRRTALVTMLLDLGCKPVTGRPGHPRTQGKNERSHQTLQRWLQARAAPQDMTEAQALLDEFDEAFAHHYHQGLGMRTPADVLAAGPVAIPPVPPAIPAVRTAEPRARRLIVGANGVIWVGTAYRINVGSEHRGQTVTAITAGQVITVFGPTGEFLRSVHVEPGRRFYGNGKPRGTKPRNRKT